MTIAPPGPILQPDPDPSACPDEEPVSPFVRRAHYTLGGCPVAFDMVVARPLEWAAWDGREEPGWTVEPFADRVVAWRALGALDGPDAASVTAGQPLGQSRRLSDARPGVEAEARIPNRLTVAWRELVEVRRQVERRDVRSDQDRQRVADANGRLAALIAAEAREDLDAIGPDDWRLDQPEDPIAMVREGMLVFCLFVEESRSFLAAGCARLANAPEFTVRPVVIASPPVAAEGGHR